MKPLSVPTTPDQIAALLHEAVVYGHLMSNLGHGPLVIGRRRPYIPKGTDPADINRECARRYAVWRYDSSASFNVAEVDPVLVIPFLDVAAQLEAADVHANRAQAKNHKPVKP